MPGPRNNRKLFCQARRQKERGGNGGREVESGGSERGGRERGASERGRQGKRVQGESAKRQEYRENIKANFMMQLKLSVSG